MWKKLAVALVMIGCCTVAALAQQTETVCLKYQDTLQVSPHVLIDFSPYQPLICFDKQKEKLPIGDKQTIYDDGTVIQITVKELHSKIVTTCYKESVPVDCILEISKKQSAPPLLSFRLISACLIGNECRAGYLISKDPFIYMLSTGCFLTNYGMASVPFSSLKLPEANTYVITPDSKLVLICTGLEHQKKISPKDIYIKNSQGKFVAIKFDRMSRGYKFPEPTGWRYLYYGSEPGPTLTASSGPLRISINRQIKNADECFNVSVAATNDKAPIRIIDYTPSTRAWSRAL